MRIAVTYENGNVFQHFGHSEQFKVYEVEDGKILSSEVMKSEGSGHGALAGLLAENKIDVLICGGIGDGAKKSLTEAGIELVSGAEGPADDAVEAYLAGELTGSEVTCDHHHEEGHECGDHGCGDDEEGCGGSCGSCGGGCGGGAPKFEGKNVGKTVRAHYCGTFDDGTQFDSSYDRGEPLEFICGAGHMILGFDKAVANMEVGETVNVHLMPEEAYGQKDPNAVIRAKIAEIPGSEELSVGQTVYLQDNWGRSFPVTVIEKDDENIVLDANHEMAGKELNFKIELVEIKD